jgi:hypothetical protein
LDVGMMYIILAEFDYMVTREEKRKASPSDVLIKRFRRLALLLVLGCSLFSISALPYFWVMVQGGLLRFDFWYASLGVFVATRFGVQASRGSKNQDEKSQQLIKI